MVREWVKWDYELRSDVDPEGVVDRALAITQSEPQGPVYLSLPREVLAHGLESFEYSERPRMQPNLGMASPESIKEVAGLLAKAKNPIALTSALGRDEEAVPQLLKLAELLNLAVYSGGSYMNFPVAHPLHQGGMVGRRCPKPKSYWSSSRTYRGCRRRGRDRTTARPWWGSASTRCTRTTRCAASRCTST